MLQLGFGGEMAVDREVGLVFNVHERQANIGSTTIDAQHDSCHIAGSLTCGKGERKSK